MESIAEEAENLDQSSDHEDVRSEHSDQEHDNPAHEQDDGEHVLLGSHYRSLLIRPGSTLGWNCCGRAGN